MKAMQIAFVWCDDLVHSERWRQNRINPNRSHISVSACTKVSTTMPMVIRCDCQGFEGNDLQMISYGFSGIQEKKHLWYHIVMLYHAVYSKIFIRIEWWWMVSSTRPKLLAERILVSFAVLSRTQHHNPSSSYSCPMRFLGDRTVYRLCIKSPMYFVFKCRELFS